MLKISKNLAIGPDEIEMHAIRAQGAGGQNVNKVSTAIHLRFDIAASSLPPSVRERLLMLKDHRITKDGVIVIKAQQFRSQEKNRDEALRRLRDIVIQALATRKKRKPTRPSRSSKIKRIDSKVRRGRLKTSRSKVKPSQD